MAISEALLIHVIAEGHGTVLITGEQHRLNHDTACPNEDGDDDVKERRLKSRQSDGEKATECIGPIDRGCFVKAFVDVA